MNTCTVLPRKRIKRFTGPYSPVWEGSMLEIGGKMVTEKRGALFL